VRATSQPVSGWLMTPAQPDVQQRETEDGRVERQSLRDHGNVDGP
jgi:hypothetical protein